MSAYSMNIHNANRASLLLVATILCASIAGTARADTFYVATDGVDADDRAATTKQTAWRSLAYACERVPAGEHTIELGSGTFIAKRAARPKSGVTIIGQGIDGDSATRIVAAKDWKLSDNPNRGDEVPEDECLIVWRDVSDMAVRDLVLASTPDHRITAGLYGRGVKGAEVANLHVHDFRWAGLQLIRSRNLNVHHNRVENASTEKHKWHNGLIRTRWIKDSKVHHNRIVSTEGGGYGYKGGGHERVRIHHNHIEVVGGFSIESAHEHEFGVEIDHNFLNRCVSVPKGNQSADPADRDCEYTFWIHHNLMTHSYTIEGPRNHLRVSHNHIRIEKTNGRVYTHHGGTNHGPVWIHHNVIENVDRALIWMNEGLAENIFVYNNTVFCADAGDRAGGLIGAYSEERLNNWVVKNNVFVAPASQPRSLMDQKRGVPTKITATHNVCVNVTDVPENNRIVDAGALGLRRTGDKPWPFFAPAKDGPLVDTGVDVGLPANGKPDIGAYEFGDKQPVWVPPTVPIATATASVASLPSTPGDNDAQPEGAAAATPTETPEAATANDAPDSTDSSDTDPAAVSAASTIGVADTKTLVEVDWMEEMLEGGVTMIALGALSVFMLAVIAERLIMLRPHRFAPPSLVSSVLPLFGQGEYDEITERCRASRSTLGDVIAYMVTHRKANANTLAAGAGDLGGRAIAEQEHKLAALAIVAGVAPLLGLLGTMIGMIESFKLVEVFGDEGGASLLAGSISKALITTAAGLVLAIPALLAHHFLKHRTHGIAHELEEQTECVFNAWFLDAESGAGAEAPVHHTQAGEPDHATLDPVTAGTP